MHREQFKFANQQWLIFVAAIPCTNFNGILKIQHSHSIQIMKENKSPISHKTE